MTQNIHFDAVAPYTLQYTVTSTTFDLSTASAGQFEAQLDNADIKTWVGVLSGLVGLPNSVAVLTYTFLAGDLNFAGKAIVKPVITIGTGTVEGPSRELFIKQEFG